VPAVSIRAYARHRAEQGLPGTSHKAVQKAVAAGRIRLTADGQVDVEEADRLWAARTDEGHRRNPAQEPSRPVPPPRPARAAPPESPPASSHLPPEDTSGAGQPPDYQESRARREAAEAGLAELELAQEQKKLLPAADVEARLVKVFADCKNKLRGVPSRARQQDPALTAAQLALLTELIDAALEDLSGGAR
jgi:phage terminase Nu1 subunit (DNA packaging protein)